MSTCSRNSNSNNNLPAVTSCSEREKLFISSPQHMFMNSLVYHSQEDVMTPARNSNSSSHRNECTSDRHHHNIGTPSLHLLRLEEDSTERYSRHQRYKHVKRKKEEKRKSCMEDLHSSRCNRHYHHSSNRHSHSHIHHSPLLLPISILLLISLGHTNCHAFTITSSSSLRFLHVRPQAQFSSSRLASTKSSSEEIIQAVQPMKSSTAEKRLSVQRAWEEQAQLLEFDENGSGDDSSLSVTPFLDLFADAGIATVKKVSKSASQSSSSSSTSQRVKPRGRPSSVPGAMSRSTLMGINEIQSRGRRGTSTNNSFYAQNRMQKKINSKIPQSKNITVEREPSNNIIEGSVTNSSGEKKHIFTEGSFTTAIKSADNVRKSKVKKSSTSSSSASATLSKTKKKGRGRGRPRKDKNNASIDEITSVAATSTLLQVSDTLISSNTASKKIKSKSSSLKNKSQHKSEKSDSVSSTNNITPTVARNKRGELRTLRPRAKKNKESEKEGTTTGMMQVVKNGKGGKDAEPPNLQRYYRTELLTSEEEYTLGMKIQFMMNCEHVYDGLCDLLGRTPDIVEWAHACGFKEEDENKNDKNYLQSDYVNQIRPLKSDGFDPVEDANMFVGNGLVNASGPGRGRGRTKKKPPSKLRDYIDDSHIKFDSDFNEKKKSLKPLNRGTPMHFVDLMVTAKEAKQRMVQCNMRLVVSISKRYKHVGVNIADLVQEGSIGLTRAAEKFDPKKGFKFSTYASWWIQQAVFRSIAYHSRTIRLPVHVHNLLNRTRRVRQELQRILGRAPTNDEMAAELSMSLEKYNKMVRLTRKAISLDMAKYQNNPKDVGQESETSLGDTINASDVMRDENSPEQSVDRVLFRDDLKEMLKILGDDERSVIYSRYGIEDGMSRTVTTVAAQMGQSKSWVRSQECRALRKLRRPWYEKRLWEHQNSLTG